MDFLNHRKGGMVFYRVFIFSPLPCTVTLLNEYIRDCVTLKKYIQDYMSLKKKGLRIAWRKTLRTFVWISSKNSVLADAEIMISKFELGH
jgi:hypothetical protein